jgi:hypothetical protein
LNRGGRHVAAGYLGLGTIYEKQGDLSNAKTNYRKSRACRMCQLSSSRVYSDATNALIGTLEASGEKDEAEQLRRRTPDAVLASLNDPKTGLSFEQVSKNSLKLMEQETTKYGATSERGLAAHFEQGLSPGEQTRRCSTL